MHLPFPMCACMQLYAAQLLRGTQPRLAVNLPRPVRAPSATSPHPVRLQATAAPAMQEWHLTDERFIAPSLTGREDAVAGMARAAASQVRRGRREGCVGVAASCSAACSRHCCDQAIYLLPQCSGG